MKYLVKLTFHSSLHLGHDEAGIGGEGVQSIVHSDTLFSGIVNAWASLEQTFRCKGLSASVADLIASFMTGPLPFALSSAFLFHESNSGIFYYLPKPILPVGGKYGKFANTSFLNLENFKRWANGDSPQPESDPTEFLCISVIEPRVTIDRLTSAANIYQSGKVFFRQGSGLYFIADVHDDYIVQLKAAVSYLGDSGLGGERSVGCGRFEAEWVEMSRDPLWNELWDIDEPNSYMLCSLCYPSANQDLSAFASAYDLVIRKGWVFSSTAHTQLKRKTTFMLGEGSVFTSQAKGEIAVVTPTAFEAYHSVYRYGIPFWVPMRLREGEDNDRRNN